MGKKTLPTLCILKDLIMSCTFLFSLFFYLCARLGCAMKKCQKVWFPWQKPSTYGRLLETFHMVLKEKNWLRFSTFFCNLSLCLSLFQLSVKNLKPWLLRGVLIYHVLLQLMTIAIITLIKTIAQGTHKSSLISNTCLFSCLQYHIFLAAHNRKHNLLRENLTFNNITLPL